MDLQLPRLAMYERATWKEENVSFGSALPTTGCGSASTNGQPKFGSVYIEKDQPHDGAGFIRLDNEYEYGAAILSQTKFGVGSLNWQNCYGAASINVQKNDINEEKIANTTAGNWDFEEADWAVVLPDIEEQKNLKTTTSNNPTAEGSRKRKLLEQESEDNTAAGAKSTLENAVFSEIFHEQVASPVNMEFNKNGIFDFTIPENLQPIELPVYPNTQIEAVKRKCGDITAESEAENEMNFNTKIRQQAKDRATDAEQQVYELKKQIVSQKQELDRVRNELEERDRNYEANYRSREECARLFPHDRNYYDKNEQNDIRECNILVKRINDGVQEYNSLKRDVKNAMLRAGATDETIQYFMYELDGVPELEIDGAEDPEWEECFDGDEEEEE